MNKTSILITFLFLFFACSPVKDNKPFGMEVPQPQMSEEKMLDLFTDIQLVEATANMPLIKKDTIAVKDTIKLKRGRTKVIDTTKVVEVKKKYSYKALYAYLYKKHQVDEETIDGIMNYFSHHPQEMETFFDKVKARIDTLVNESSDKNDSNNKEEDKEDLSEKVKALKEAKEKEANNSSDTPPKESILRRKKLDKTSKIPLPTSSEKNP